eukprot:gene28616-31786_t
MAFQGFPNVTAQKVTLAFQGIPKVTAQVCCGAYSMFDCVPVALQKCEIRTFFKVANAEDLSAIESDSIDVVTCCYGYMFPADKVKALKETLRVLKPGGVMIGEDKDFQFNMTTMLVKDKLKELGKVEEARAAYLANIPKYSVIENGVMMLPNNTFKLTVCSK